MDTSKDSMMDATYHFLKEGVIEGARCLPVEQLAELLGDCVRSASIYLRHTTLPTIVSQTTFKLTSIPDEARNQHAFKVYEVGAEPWTDVDTVEYWFVGRDGAWYWVKCDTVGGSADFAMVTSRHLAERFCLKGEPALASIGVLGSVAERFRHTGYIAAHRARERADELDGFVRAMKKIGSDVSLVVEPNPT